MSTAASHLQDYANRVIQAMGLEPADFHQTSSIFSLKSPPKSWSLFSCDAFFPIYRIRAPAAKVSDVKAFISGIRRDGYVIVAELDDFNVLCMSPNKKGEQPYVLALRKEEDYDRVVSVLRKYNFTSDELSAAVAIDTCIDLLKSGAERDFINRGLFSNYFLQRRLESALTERRRDVRKETGSFFSQFTTGGSGVPTDFECVPKILQALGYCIKESSSDKASGEKQFTLNKGSTLLETAVVVASQAENLDIMSSPEKPVPSVQAVSALDTHPWAILTNGRLWRLYSARVSSASTNYFEVDLEGVTDEKDPKLKYFVGLFSAAALTPRQGMTDVDFVFDGGVEYGKELEEDLRKKVFKQQLFLDFVRAVIQHSPKKKYSEEVLADAKKKALKLLYRLLFILYAESRNLLPKGDSRYEQISLGKVRERLMAMEKDPEGNSTWSALQRLFKAISRGDPNVNVPEYDGALFEEDDSIDKLKIMNKHLVPALRALTEKDGKGIDYQNLGVRQLGSLYEALLEYTISQADTDLVIIKDEILDMSFASELKKKPERIIEKGDIYLTAGGLARKGTGSYYTPDKIVRFLVRKGLEPIFEDREKKLKEHFETWKRTGSKEAAQKSIDVLLDIQVVDPAMGSGHFLVTVVDEITRWIMGILKRHPDAPLAKEIGDDREQIIAEQKKKGIKLDKELLTFNVILKRRVMKRCVFGVDINPLAVELAKLSLWLDSFTIGTPLTFLDHHIRSGDSLIGLWLDNFRARKPDNSTLDMWTGSVESSGDLLQEISYPADLTIQEVKKSKENYEDFKENTEPKRNILDILTAGIMDKDLEKRLPRNLSLVEQTISKGKLKEAAWSEPVLKSLEYAKKYQFFHWELEFPDAFVDERRGFDLVVMNPPWDAVKPDDDDFFSQYERRFRRIKSKTDKKKIKEKLLKELKIAKAFAHYTETIEKRVSFYKLSGQYQKRGSGDTDLWKLFLERVLQLVNNAGGTLSVVMPSGVLNNEGAKELRQSILDMKVRHLYEFDNIQGIFPDIHSDYKFVLLITDNEKSPQEFPAAFYLHDMNALEGKSEQEKFVKISSQFVKLASPDSLSIPEVRVQREVELFKKIYAKHPLLSTGIDSGRWTFRFVREIDRTNAAHLFKTDGKGWPLIEGKHFHQFIPNYEKYDFTVRVDEGLKWTSKVREYGSLNKEFHDVCRLAFRNFGGSTNIRSIIASVLPKHTFVPNNGSIVVPRLNGNLVLNDEYYRIIAYLCGIFNSCTFDFLVFRRVFMNLNFFLVYQTPVPLSIGTAGAREIAEISARLNSIDKDFADFAKANGVEYGYLTMKERLSLTAKLDALAAHHYGLVRDDYQYILSTFEDFREGKEIENLSEIKWDESLIKKFNGEVRKRALSYYDNIGQSSTGREAK